MLANIIETKRYSRLPEDSGEWKPVPITFRRLPTAEQQPRTIAPALFAGLILMVVHVALFGVCAAHFDWYVAAIMPVGLVSAAVGVLWLAQFQPLNTDEGARFGAKWMFAAALLPGLILPELWAMTVFSFIPQVGAGAVGGTVMARAIRELEARRGNA